MSENLTTEVVTSTEKAPEGWSWGGALLLIYVFVIARKWGFVALLFVLYFIPLLNLIAIIGGFIYGGLKGKEIVYNSDRFDSHAEKIGAIKSIEAIGIFTIVMFVIGTVLSILFGSILAGIIMSNMR